MDFMNFFGLTIGSLVVCYGYDSLIQNLKLKREEKRGFIIDKPFEIVDSKTTYKKMYYGELEDCFKVCIDIFTGVLGSSQFDLKNFYNNFSSRCFVEKYRRTSNIRGQFVLRKNKILLYNKLFMTYVFHELLHMASAVYKKSSSYVGFRIHSNSCNKSKIIGNGLNEGYTEYLAQKYFSMYGHLASACYAPLVSLARLLEVLVGEDLMVKYYSNAYLYGLVDKLCEFGSMEEITLILKKMDTLLSEIKMINVDRKILFNSRYKSYIELVLLISKLYARAMVDHPENVVMYYKKIMDVLSLDLKHYEVKKRDKEMIIDVMHQEYSTRLENSLKKI